MARAHIHTNRFDKDPTGAEGHGYAKSGESQWTRVAAHGGNSAPRRDPAEPRSRPGQVNGFLPSDENIRRCQVEIGKLESVLMFERRIDPRSPKIAKLEKNLRIKNEFLRQLGRERNDPHYRREKIRV